MDALARAHVGGADEADALELGLHAGGLEGRVVGRRRLQGAGVDGPLDVDALGAVEVLGEEGLGVVAEEEEVLDAVGQVRLDGHAERGRRVVDVVGRVVDARDALRADEVVEVLDDLREGALLLALRGLGLDDDLPLARGLELLPERVAALDDAPDVRLPRVEVVAVAPAVVAPERALAQDRVVVEDGELLVVRPRLGQDVAPRPAEVPPEDALDLDARRPHDAHPRPDPLPAPQLLDPHAALALLLPRQVRRLLEHAPLLHRRIPPRPQQRERLRHGGSRRPPGRGRRRLTRRQTDRGPQKRPLRLPATAGPAQHASFSAPTTLVTFDAGYMSGAPSPSYLFLPLLSLN